MKHSDLFMALLFALSCVTWVALPAAAENAPISDSHSYPLATCPVTGQSLDAMGGAVTETINDREVRFCCAGCVAPYREDTAAFEAKIDAAIVEQQKENYPTDRCVVMDTALGSMGDPVDYVHKNRLVRFCCAGCVGMFEEDPETYLDKLDAAVLEKGLENAPDSCVVTGEALGDAPVKMILANQLLMLHSDACVEAVRENPAEYLESHE